MGAGGEEDKEKEKKTTTSGREDAMVVVRHLRRRALQGGLVSKPVEEEGGRSRLLEPASQNPNGNLTWFKWLALRVCPVVLCLL